MALCFCARCLQQRWLFTWLSEKKNIFPLCQASRGQGTKCMSVLFSHSNKILMVQWYGTKTMTRLESHIATLKKLKKTFQYLDELYVLHYSKFISFVSAISELYEYLCRCVWDPFWKCVGVLFLNKNHTSCIWHLMTTILHFKLLSKST